MKVPHTMIRLARYGCTNRPFYHIVAIQSTLARNSPKIYEQLGTYDPLPNIHNEKLVSLNIEKLKMWLSRGATPSRPVAQLLGLSGFLPLHPTSVIVARRARILAAKKAKEAEEAAAKAEQIEQAEES